MKTVGVDDEKAMTEWKPLQASESPFSMFEIAIQAASNPMRT